MKKLIGIVIIICILMNVFIISSNADEEVPATEVVAEEAVESTEAVSEEVTEESQEVTESIEEGNEENTEEYTKNVSSKSICIFLLILSVIFIVSLIIISGLRSIRVIVSSVVSILVIVLFFMKALLWGWNTILIIFITTLITLLFNLGVIKGFNQKFIVAFLGNFIACVLIGITAFVFICFTKLFGICNEILAINNFGTINFNYTYLVITTSIFLALGICLEIGYSIANFLFENKNANSDMGLLELIKSARGYGKEIVSSKVIIMMFNVLCIMNIVFLFMQFSNFIKISLYELYTQIFLLFVCGILGILYTIVCTAFTFWILYSKQTEYRKKSSNIVEGKRSLKI